MKDKKNSAHVDNIAQQANKEAIDACKKELAEVQEKFMHVSADLANFKRRVEKERMMWIRNAQKEVLYDILSIVDDFDRAVIEHQKKERTPELETWLSGFEMIHNSLYEFLKKHGVTPIDNMKQFNPELHEAIAQVDSSEHTSGDIVELMQKGFMFHDQLLRPAKVVVAK